MYQARGILSGCRQRERVGNTDKFGKALNEPPCLPMLDSLPRLPETNTRLKIPKVNELARHRKKVGTRKKEVRSVE